MLSDNTDERVSIWSVQGRHRYVFSLCVIVLFFVSIVSIWWYERESLCTILDTIKVVLAAGAFSVTSVFIGYEGWTVMTVATEFFKRAQRAKGRQEGRQEGLREVFDWLAKEHPNITVPPSLLEELNGKEPDDKT